MPLTLRPANLPACELFHEFSGNTERVAINFFFPFSTLLFLFSLPSNWKFKKENENKHEWTRTKNRITQVNKNKNRSREKKIFVFWKEKKKEKQFQHKSFSFCEENTKKKVKKRKTHGEIQQQLGLFTDCIRSSPLEKRKNQRKSWRKMKENKGNNGKK